MREDHTYQHLDILETEIGNTYFIRTEERRASPKKPSNLPVKFIIRYNALLLKSLANLFFPLFF